MGAHNASSKPLLKGRLPESLGLSLGLHALLFLIPTGFMMGSAPPQTDPSPHLYLVEARTPAKTLAHPTTATPSPPDDRLSAPNTNNSEQLPLPGPQHLNHKAPVTPEERGDVRNEKPETTPRPNPSRTPTPPPTKPTSDHKDDTPPLTQTNPSLSDQSLPKTDANAAPAEPEPNSKKLQNQRTAPNQEEQTTTMEDVLRPATLLPTPEAPKPIPEKEERNEFARARSSSEELTPNETTRISDKDMFADQEQRAPVASTAEGSAELGVNAEAAKAGQPSTPGSPPSGQRGDKGHSPQTSLEKNIPTPTQQNKSPSPLKTDTSLEEAPGTPQGPEHVPTRLPNAPSRHEQKAKEARLERQAQNDSTAHSGQTGFTKAESPDGDISRLLEARKRQRAQDEQSAQVAQMGSVFSSGQPSSSALVDPGEIRGSSPERPHIALPASTDTAGAQHQTLHGDGMAELGDADTNNPHTSTFRPGKKMGAARLPSPGHRARSATAPLTVASDRIAIGSNTQVNAHRTPLGVYVARIEDEIRNTWVLPLELRAMGVQGNVEVVFTVNRRGRVTQKAISRHSGNPALDRVALQAIPNRLHRIPRALGQREISFSYLFRTTDTIIAGSR